MLRCKRELCYGIITLYLLHHPAILGHLSTNMGKDKWSPTSKAPQEANIPYQRTYSPTGRTRPCPPECVTARKRGPLGSG
jgi:hypothetical protein